MDSIVDPDPDGKTPRPREWKCPSCRAHTRLSAACCDCCGSARPVSAATEAFTRWIVSLDDDDPMSMGRQERRTVTLTQIVNLARAALGDDVR